MDKLYRQDLTGQSRFTLNGQLEDFVDMLLLNINRAEFDPGWEKGEMPATEFKNLSFDSVSCYEVLAILANEFAMEYRITGRRISFAERVEQIRDLKFEQGYGNGLYTLRRQNVDSDNTVTRAYVYGSMENLPLKYREGRFDRLVPADEDGEVILYFENRTEYAKIVERDVFFDDVKPSFTGSVKTVSGMNNRTIGCPEIDFDLNDKNIAIGDQARINFLTGALMGVGFQFNYNHARKEITLIGQEDDTATAGGNPEYAMLPNPNRKPAPGDKFNFTGIFLPAAYVRDAEKRLAEKGRKWMEVYSKLRVKYNLDVDYHYLRELGETLDVGDVVRIVVGEGQEQQLRITSLKKQLATGQLTCEVSNFLAESWEKQVEGKIQQTRSSVELSKSEVLYSINATKDWVGRNFGQLSEKMGDGKAIVWDETAHRIKTVEQVPDTVLWDGLKMPDWLDQPVKTSDGVKFKQVVAEALIEQAAEDMPVEQVAAFLVEEGEEGVVPVTLGELENVDVAADTAGEEDVVLFRAKGSGEWTLKPLAGIGGGGDGEIQRNVRLVNRLDSKNIAASKGEPCFLNFTFISQERYGYNDPYEDTGERGLLQVSVRGSENAEYAIVREMYIQSGQVVSLDVAEYLTSGVNQVMLKVTGEVTEAVTPAFVYTVQLTSLSVSIADFKWWTAYTGDIHLPVNIGGNVSKKIYVRLEGTDYDRTYEVPVGVGIYLETPFNYVVKHPGKPGVFTLSVYVANLEGTIRTRTLSRNIICAVAGEQVKLMAINNKLEKATNWTENTLFEYSLYDGDQVNTFARFAIIRNGQEIFSSEEDSITTSAKHAFAVALEVETIDNADFDIAVHIQDGDTGLVPPVIFPVGNSLSYSAVPGAVLFLNPRTRNNNQSNREQLINEVDGSGIDAVWENMNWGNDGWQTDKDGNKMLRVMAGSAVEVDYAPFASECARTGKTIEVDFRIDQITDFSRPVFCISSVTGESFIGLNIYPDEIVMHSQALKNTGVQNIHTFEGQRVRFALTVIPTLYGNSGFNMVIMYVNGVKNREFTYENNDYFAHNGKIRIGSDHCDIDVYGVRIYDSGLTSQGVLTNYINWLGTTEEKLLVKRNNDIMDAQGAEVDFENTVDQYNVIVYDNRIPGILAPSPNSGTLSVYFAGHPEWNVEISAVDAKGQGTSSMKYYLWNTRYTIHKTASVITYADGTTGRKEWAMIPDLPAASKITAKKNYASSMQSHKIGAVNSYQLLWEAMGHTNEARESEKYAHARIAVYQEPFLCFEKSENEDGETVYTFRGLYTMGPDKGDKNTFGYDTELFPGLISIEGADNSPLLTLFRVPWNPAKPYIAYNADEEAFQYNGANAYDFDGGKVENISRFIPAYNIVYTCSPRLKPFEGSLEELNARATELRSEPYEFWIAKEGEPEQYNLYYFESAENRFIPSDIGEGTVNLLSQLADKGWGLSASDLAGKTNAEKNDLFIRARIQRFRQEAPAWWDIADCLTYQNNVEFNAGTDERAKNTYPYCFGNEGSKWKWRIDDADTRFDTDNEGQPEKSYSIEVHDVTAKGAAVWNGETNNFWNLMELAFADEKVTDMRMQMTKMQELGGLKSGNDLDRLFAFYRKFFFDRAQYYFPQNGYNMDAKVAYEYGKLAYRNGSYTNDTDPLHQSLGDHFLAEQRWITKRIIYMMSKYSFGMFSANGTDTITVRAAGHDIEYELTPGMDLYPAIANGTSIIRGARTKAGEVCRMVIELSGSGDQQNTIHGASFLQDIGDWHGKNITGSMIIQGRMLREIRLGSETEPVVISISSLTISNCTSLQKLVLSNIPTLAGTLDLTACSHLQEVYAGGTALAQIKLPAGGGLRKIAFSAYNQYLLLSNYPLLNNEGIDIKLCKEVITDFFVVDCPQVRPMQLLIDIMEAQAGQGTEHQLKRIRAVGFEETYQNEGMLDKLAELADGSYVGLNSEGIAGEEQIPVLEGTLNIYANVYEDSVEALRNTFRRLTLEVIGKLYLRFKDRSIGKYFIDNYGDATGVTKEQLAGIKSLKGSLFEGNKEIVSFEEFRYFTGLASVPSAFMRQCSNLKSIVFPSQLTNLANNSFAYSGIETVIIPAAVSSMEQAVFSNCSELSSVIFEERDSRVVLKWGVFQNCLSLTEVELPDSLVFENGTAELTFSGCSSLKSVHFPENESVVSIPRYTFKDCPALSEINSNPYITRLDTGAFQGCKSLVSLPDFPNLTTIGDNAFMLCTSLKTLDLSHTPVTSIGRGVFDNSGLEEVIWNDTITSLGIACFAYCKFESFEFPEKITIIAQEVLRRNVPLKHVILPSGVTEIGKWAFATNALDDLVCFALVPPVITNDIFAYGSVTAIYVPDESVGAYRKATNWSVYANKIYPLSQKST